MAQVIIFNLLVFWTYFRSREIALFLTESLPQFSFSAIFGTSTARFSPRPRLHTRVKYIKENKNSACMFYVTNVNSVSRIRNFHAVLGVRISEHEDVHEYVQTFLGSNFNFVASGSRTTSSSTYLEAISGSFFIA